MGFETLSLTLRSADHSCPVSLDVTRIEPVIWGNGGFEWLVLAQQSKDIIAALVANHMQVKKGTDTRKMKGGGLFFSLHG